jgi:hypothetical protein
MLVTGRIEDGLDFARTSANLDPDSPIRNDPLITGLLLSGDYDEAIDLIRHFEQLPDPDANSINWWWSMLYYQQNNEQKLREKVAARVQELETGPGEFSMVQTAFFVAWLDGTDAALPILRIAHETHEFRLIWPDLFYLPEDISDDPDWLSFWQQPPLAELMDIRRANKTQEHVGYWKERNEP